MDKKKVIEIAETESFNHIKFISEDKQECAEYYFNSVGLQALAAAILLEAAKVCETLYEDLNWDKDCAKRWPRQLSINKIYAEKLEQLAKELTQ